MSCVYEYLLTCIAVACFSIFALLKWRRHALGSHAFPPALQAFQSHPLIGNLLDVMKAMPMAHDAILEKSAKCNFRTWAFSIPFMATFFVVTSPENLEYVLKTRSNNFVKGSTFRKNLGQILGGGIFAVDGQEWYWQRKLATHIFNVRR
jgi:cytochrome P450